MGTVAIDSSVLMRLSGPSTSTLPGFTMTGPSSKPSVGCPSIVGTTGTVFVNVRSRLKRTLDGFTRTTSAPNGACTFWRRQRNDLFSGFHFAQFDLCGHIRHTDIPVPIRRPAKPHLHKIRRVPCDL